MTDFLRPPDLIPQCEHSGCLAIPDLAPVVFVPSRNGQHYDPLKLWFPHLHYCRAHWQTDMHLDDLLDDKAKARFEAEAKKKWPHDGLPDFDASLVVPMEVWSEEYAAYMQRMGFKTDGLGFSLLTHPRMARV